MQWEIKKGVVTDEQGIKGLPTFRRLATLSTN